MKTDFETIEIIEDGEEDTEQDNSCKSNKKTHKKKQKNGFGTIVGAIYWTKKAKTMKNINMNKKKTHKKKQKKKKTISNNKDNKVVLMKWPGNHWSTK